METKTKKTIDDLRVHRGMPVPWVARWSDEEDRRTMLRPRLVQDNFWRWPLMEYEIDVPRDEDGVLWQKDGHSRTGIPQFGQVHTGRVVNCMKNRRCQVCGSKIDTETTLFLVGQVESMAPIVDGRMVTTTPPTCEPCADQAVTLCPDLKQHHRRIVAKSYKKLAVWGALYRVEGEGPNMSVQMIGLRDVPYGTPAIRAVVGKQMTIEIEVAE